MFFLLIAYYYLGVFVRLVLLEVIKIEFDNAYIKGE